MRSKVAIFLVLLAVACAMFAQNAPAPAAAPAGVRPRAAGSEAAEFGPRKSPRTGA